MYSLKQAVLELYTDLERVSLDHSELTDTDVRDAIHLTLNYLFVWGKSPPKMPVCFEMFSLEGDQAVAAIISKFQEYSLVLQEEENIPVGQERLNILQDESITTPGGESYDLFIGDVDEPLPANPLYESYFSPGEYGKE